MGGSLHSDRLIATLCPIPLSAAGAAGIDRRDRRGHCAAVRFRACPGGGGRGYRPRHAPETAALSGGFMAAICSFIILAISRGVGSAMWVATDQQYPSGSMREPHRSPQNMSVTGIFWVAPSFSALANTLSAFSTYR